MLARRRAMVSGASLDERLLAAGFTWRHAEAAEPLLRPGDVEEAPQTTQPDTQPSGDDAAAEPQPVPPSFGRLLTFARPERGVISAGLVALLLRLPFSLAMPHFVAVALGHVLAGDFTAARSSIVSFFCVGFVNAVLDFSNWRVRYHLMLHVT